MEIYIIAAFFCGVFAACWFHRDRGTYRIGRVPELRECVDCGQEQWLYTDTLEYGVDYWRASGEIKNPKCKCHKDLNR
jgi:hypothetical protein